jgi:hypothetical protein
VFLNYANSVKLYPRFPEVLSESQAAAIREPVKARWSESLKNTVMADNSWKAAAAAKAWNDHQLLQGTGLFGGYTLPRSRSILRRSRFDGFASRIASNRGANLRSSANLSRNSRLTYVSR